MSNQPCGRCGDTFSITHCTQQICPLCTLKDMPKLLLEAERRGEERGFNAARRANNGCVISIDYSEGGGPKYPRLSDWRASEEYKEGK